MFILSIMLTVIAAIVVSFSFAFAEGRTVIRSIAGSFFGIALILFVFSMFTSVAASNIGVVTVFGKVEPEVLTEGAHFVAPWAKVTPLYLGQQQASANNSEAGSRDLQSVHASLSVNYTIDPSKAKELYIQNPTLSYNALLVSPAIFEVFKSVVAQYTAEDLIVKRSEVSAAITHGLATRLAQYHLIVQNVNLVHFGFSQSFDAAIEQKVTASQKAETAKRNLERVKYEADARISQAEGEAKAISIQAAATQQSGGAAYIQLQAIGKWDGKLPQYVTAGSAVPFINIK